MTETVLFDARLILEKPTGIGQYISSLLPELLRQAPNVQFHLLRRSHPFPGYGVEAWRAPNLAHHVSALPHMSVRQQIVLPHLAERLGATLIHYPHFDAPVWIRQAAVVATIHDTKYLANPALFPGLSYAKRLYMRFCFARTLRHAKAVIAVSQATANDLQRLFGQAGANIRVIHSAADPTFCPADASRVDAVRRKYRLDRPYILAVGEFRPHKNAVGLLRAYAAGRSRTTHDLVLVGQAYGDYKEPWDIARELNLAEHVHFLTDVSAADLGPLYSAASLFVLVSFYEGFGLPLLEAMACATPVLASATTATGEITGDGGMRVDPNDTAAIATAMDAITQDLGLQQTLSDRGRHRAAEFTWQRTAGETLALYEQVWHSQ